MKNLKAIGYKRENAGVPEWSKGQDNEKASNSNLTNSHKIVEREVRAHDPVQVERYL